MGYIKLVNGVPQVEKVRRDHGIAIHVPEKCRTYYIHFASPSERDLWFVGVATNIEISRRDPRVIEDMISKARPLAPPTCSRSGCSVGRRGHRAARPRGHH